MQVYYSQDIRSYSMFAFTGVASWLGLAVWLDKRDRKSAALYVGSTLLLLYTHAFGVLIVAAQNIFLGWSLWRDRLTGGDRVAWLLLARRWTGMQGLTVLLFSPWIWAVANQVGRLGGGGFWLWKPDVPMLLGSVGMFVGIQKPPWLLPPPDWGRIAVAFVVFAAVLVVAAAVTARWFQTTIEVEERAPTSAATRRFSMLLTWFLVPVLCAWLVSQTSMHIYTHRNVIVSAPALLLLIAIGLDRLPNGSLRMILLSLALAPSVGNYPWYYGAIHKEDWRGAQLYVVQSFQRGDRFAVPQEPTLRWPSAWYLDHEGYGRTEIEEIDLSGTAPSGNRIWTITYRSRVPSQELVAAGYPPAEIKYFYGGVVVIRHDRVAQQIPGG